MALLDVIKWDAAPQVLAYKYPNSQINTNSRLIVSESQEAVVLLSGQFNGPFGPGGHTLNTQNLPILSKLFNIPYGGQSPYSAEVWFVQKTSLIDVRWGTETPIQIEDPKYHIFLPVRAFGQYGIKIINSRKFLAKIVGTLPAYTVSTLSPLFKGILQTHIKNKIANVISNDGTSILQINTHLERLSAIIEMSVRETVEEYGVDIVNFCISSIETDAEDPAVARLRQAMAKRAEMEIVGFDYQQERSFDSLQAAASNEGSGSIVPGMVGVQVASMLGVSIGNQMGNILHQVTGGHCISCGGGLAAGAKFCGNCGAVVLRVCSNCQTPVQGQGVFCSNCGTKYSNQ